MQFASEDLFANPGFTLNQNGGFRPANLSQQCLDFPHRRGIAEHYLPGCWWCRAFTALHHYWDPRVNGRLEGFAQRIVVHRLRHKIGGPILHGFYDIQR